MSNWKDRLKDSQGGEQTNSPKLGAAYHFEMRKNENRDNSVGFSYYKKSEKEGEKGSIKFIHKPLEGILLGTAMVMTAYSEELGRNGGTYRTSYYWKKDNVKLYHDGKLIVKGSVDDVQKFFATNAENKGSKRQVIFLLTKQGIVTVTTNLSIAIEQIYKVRPKAYENFIVLTPELFNDQSDVSNKTQGYLGKFLKKNPPLFADIKVGRPISDEDAVSLNLSEKLDHFQAWLKHQQGEQSDLAKNEIEGARPSSYNPHEDFATDDAHDASQAKAPVNSDPLSALDDDDDIDDLPF